MARVSIKLQNLLTYKLVISLLKKNKYVKKLKYTKYCKAKRCFTICQNGLCKKHSKHHEIVLLCAYKNCYKKATNKRLCNAHSGHCATFGCVELATRRSKFCKFCQEFQ